jgi:SAM-dependent MidA family methyltransferase
VSENLGDLEPVSGGVIFANELLDVLPFRRVRIRDGEAVELRVGLGPDGRFVEVEAACDSALGASIEPAASGGEHLELSVPVGAMAFVDELAHALERGWALLIDYGPLDRQSSGEPRAYRSHRVLEDVLREPGSADITGEVDLGAIEAAATRRGLRVDGHPSQREALVSLGMGEWARAQLELQGALVRERAGLEAARAWSGRSRATLLIDPAALGRLRWLVLSRGAVPVPDWIAAPAAHRPGGA